MSLPFLLSLDGLALGELRDAVGTLMAEVSRLRAENLALRDEIARLKGLPPRPPVRPSGMDMATSAAADPSKPSHPKRKRGGKRDRDAVTIERVLAAVVPAGSRFKGYEDILVRDLRLSAEVIRYRRERWLAPCGKTVVAALPAGIAGGFGPELRRFVLALHAQGQVTTERLTALLRGMGVEISKRQVVRLIAGPLDVFVTEERDVLRAGLASARWITVDDTAARHAGTDGFTTQVGDNRFTAFRTGPSKSREAFLSGLRAGHADYAVNAAALDYMRGRRLAGPVVAMLAAAPDQWFADAPAWTAHLARLGIDRLAVSPDPVQVATEGALWGAVHHHRLLERTVIVSDAAGQFRVGDHALCWVHAERLVHKLMPGTAAQQKATTTVRALIWRFYAGLKAYKRHPSARQAAALRAWFDRIFGRKTGYVTLDRLLARLHRRKTELLCVLRRPEIPLHTNGSENDIRACVTKRKISGGTVSAQGRTARDVMLGLMKTCAKLGVSFFRYIGHRLGIPSEHNIEPLPNLVRLAAHA